jgi:hypothetical protein
MHIRSSCVSSPSLLPDLPRTSGMRQTETQPAVSHNPAAGMRGLSRSHSVNIRIAGPAETEIIRSLIITAL